MERRKFVQNTVLAGDALFSPGAIAAHQSSKAEKEIPTADKSFNLNYGIHNGMFSNHAGKDFIDQIKFAYDHRFRAMEDNGMMGRTPDLQKKIGDSLSSLGMMMGFSLFPLTTGHYKVPLLQERQNGRKNF